MKRFASLAFVVLGLIGASLSLNASCRADGMYDYYQGNKYTSEITAEQVQHSPQWSLNEDNPPLPARKALKAATEMLTKLLPDADKCTLESITLKPVCGHAGWAYVVTFDSYFPHTPGVPTANSGYLPPIHFFVLMSGAVIEPTVTQEKLGRSNTALHPTPPAALSHAGSAGLLGRRRG